MDNLYGAKEDGYCGDEDNGQTSAWFVFSSLGFYPVAPVTGQYVIGSPLFENVVIELSNGNKLTINASNNNSENLYINNLTFNGLETHNNWFSHQQLKNGGIIDFTMSSSANNNWGSSKKSVPFSMSIED